MQQFAIVAGEIEAVVVMLLGVLVVANADLILMLLSRVLLLFEDCSVAKIW